MRTLQRFATVCFLGATVAALLSACGSSDSGSGGSSAGAATAGASGAHTAGAAGAATAGAATGGAGGGAAAGAPGAGGAQPTGVAANGATLYKMQSPGCNACHGDTGAGTLGPNITKSMTAGIGSWTQSQFHNAVRGGTNKAGAKLCILMAPFTEAALSEQGVADIWAYLQSLPAVDTAMPGTYCSGGTCAQVNSACTSDH